MDGMLNRRNKGAFSNSSGLSAFSKKSVFVTDKSGRCA